MRLIRHLNERKKLADYYETPLVKKDYMDIHTEFSESKLDELLKLIHKECKPWLKEIGNFSITEVPNPVFRGIEESVKTFSVKKGTRRIDRAPKFTQKEVFEIFDKAFADKFGWWVRSKGVFTGSEHVSYSYGTPYVFFPMGKYKYVWSSKYQDVWHYLTHPTFWEGLTDKEKKKHIINAKINAKLGVKQYNNKNIRTVMRTSGIGYEAIFDCKKYLLMTYKAYKAIANRI